MPISKRPDSGDSGTTSSVDLTEQLPFDDLQSETKSEPDTVSDAAVEQADSTTENSEQTESTVSDDNETRKN